MKKSKVEIYLIVGWLEVVFNPELFGFWREDKKNGYIITKLKLHQYKLNNYLPTEDVVKLKEAIADFIKKNVEFQNKGIIQKHFFSYKMKESAKKIFECANEILEKKPKDPTI